MERFYNLRKIEVCENEIKLKTENLQKLKSENSSLNYIKKNQNKGFADFEEKNDNKHEIKILFDKLQNLKEEYKFSKDLQKNSEANIKKLNSKIIALEEKNRKIREVIELKKKLENYREKNENISEHPLEYLNKLDEKIKFTEIQISSDERGYKNEINKQNIIIAKLNDEMAILNLDIKDKEQQIKINDLMQKESKKIKNLSNLRRNLNEVSLLKNPKIEIKKERAISANIKFFHPPQPTIPTPINTRQNRNKPFDIQKFSTGNNTNYDKDFLYLNNKMYTNAYTNYNEKKTNLERRDIPFGSKSRLKVNENNQSVNKSMISQIEKLSNNILKKYFKRMIYKVF